MSFIIHYFKLFYRHVGIKLILFTFFALFTSIIDGLGISFILPILDYGSDKIQRSKYSEFIYQFLESINIEVSLTSLVILIFLIFLFKAVIKFTQEVIGAYITQNLTKKSRIDLVERYRQMKYTFFINTEIGYFNNIISVEIAKFVGAFKRYIALIIESVQILIYLSYSFLFSWEISILAIVSGIIIYILYFPFLKRVSKLSKIIVKTNARLQNAFIQFILNYKYLKATSNFKNPVKNLIHQIDELKKKGFMQSVIEIITPVSLEPISIIIFSVGLLFLVEYQGREISTILVTLLFLYKTILRLPILQSYMQRFMSLSGSVDVVENARESLRKNIEANDGEDIHGFFSEIALHNVNFFFRNKQILYDININITKDHTIGIVGESGSGKTTLLDIITGLLVPRSGKVEIDGVDYKSLNKKTLRRLFGYNIQEPVIFNDSIFNNITMWMGDINDMECLNKVDNACQIANCADFIQETEYGYKSIVGDRGIRLSGGQRQRLSIAREIFRKTKITIFDEATSSLDTKSENIIQNSINKLIGEQTMIIIAHRLSTVRNCDYIYVMNKGRVVQEGNWDDLISDSNSVFVKMCRLQGIVK